MSSKYIFFTNLWSHVTILFLALTLLFWFVISRTERSAMTKEFKNQIDSNLPAALQSANISSGGSLKVALEPTLPALELMSQQIENDTLEDNVDSYNNMLLYIALLIFVIFLSIIASSLITTKLMGNVKNLGKKYAFVIFENVVVFLFIGAIEFTFFQQVASKFVPVKPSFLVNRLIEDLKNTFS